MFNFESFLNLPLIWYGLIWTAILVYAMLDGFDLGLGILFPFAPSGHSRDQMMNSAAPFWDGNETWLVLGGGGLFAVFPLAYAVLMPAFYVPVILMLLGLVFRGVSFEFRFKTTGRSRWVWDLSFHLGSLTAALMQGMMIGALVQGVSVEGRQFGGGLFDWASGFSFMTGIALITGYGLLGTAWTIMKTEGKTQAWARQSARTLMLVFGLLMALTLVTLLMQSGEIHSLGLRLAPAVFYLIQPMAILMLLLFVLLWRALRNEKYEYQPFFLTLGIFLTSGIGMIAIMWPWLVPFEITYENAAAVPESLSFLLAGAVFLIPAILAYTGYCFWVFRGKASRDHHAAY